MRQPLDTQQEQADVSIDSDGIDPVQQEIQITLPLRSAISGTRDLKQTSPWSGDINTAAALRAQYAIPIPKSTRRRHKKMTTQIIDDENNEVIIDQTTPLPLHSKKTERLQRKQQKRTGKLATQHLHTTTLLSLPSELLTDIFTHLTPTDIASLHLTSQHLHTHLTTHETLISRTIIRHRYWTLYRCFPLPIAFHAVDPSAHAALLSPKRQEMLNIHRKSYHQHIQMIDPHAICTCMTCVFAWNNLCLILDLHHWQTSLESREPLPIIPRGTNPAWNTDLLARNARMVRAAMDRPLVHARILQLHLDTVTRTILRNARWRRKPSSSTTPVHTHNVSLAARLQLNAKVASEGTKQRLYRLTDDDVVRETDEYLERSGPPSWDFPYMRDNYYSLEAYLPNRRWSADAGRWFYYGLNAMAHEKDLEFVRSWAAGVGWRGS